MELLPTFEEYALGNSTTLPPDHGPLEWYWINDTSEYTNLFMPAADFGYMADGTGGLMGGDLDQQEVQDIIKDFRDTLVRHTGPKTILLICLYVPIFITALVGNILVLLVVLPNRLLRNVTNCFIVNLAVADLLVTIICIPIAIGESIHKPWIYGEFMCKVRTYMQGVSVAASVFTLMVLSADRFLAIRHPMTFRSFSTSRYAAFILVSLWLVSFSIMIPFLLISNLQTLNIGQQIEPVQMCAENWHKFQGRPIYVTFLFVFMFVIPGCFITASYSLIGCKLWTEKQYLHRRDSQAGREQTEKVMTGRRRVARMLVALAIVFACCWLPYHLHSLYIDFITPQPFDAIEALPFTICLGHANSALNPILYCFMNRTFRRTAAKLLHMSRGKTKRKHDNAPVNVVVHYKVSAPTHPTATQEVPLRPAVRSWSNSSVTGTRSTAGSLRLSRSTPNSTKSSVCTYSSRRSMDGRRRSSSSSEKDTRVYRIPFSHIAAAEKVLQHEVYPPSQAAYAHSSRRRSSAKDEYETSDPIDIMRRKREILNYALSIPTTINEETSKGSRSISPLAEFRPIANYDDSPERPKRDFNGHLYPHSTNVAEHYTSWRSEELSRHEELLDNLHSNSHHRILDEVDIQIHVPRN